MANTADPDRNSPRAKRLRELAKLSPIQSFMVSSHRFLWLPLHLVLSTAPCWLCNAKGMWDVAIPREFPFQGHHDSHSHLRFACILPHWWFGPCRYSCSVVCYSIALLAEWQTVQDFTLSIRTPSVLAILVLKLKSFWLPVDVSKNCSMSDKRCKPWSDAAFCSVWSGFTLFTHAYARILRVYIWSFKKAVFQQLGLRTFIIWQGMFS